MRLVHLALVALVAIPMLAGCTAPGGGSSSPSHSSPSSTPSTASTTGCANATRASFHIPANHTAVAISTSAGCMVAELYDDKAPITVANFKTYVNEGFYTNLHCYRIIAGFVNQCGGGADGKAGSHPAIHNEASTSGLHNKQYTVAMARLGPECNTGCPDKPDSATTEFYINAADNCFLDPRATSSCASQAVNDAGYAVFGVLVSGHDVSDHLNTMGRQSPAPALQSVTLLA